MGHSQADCVTKQEVRYAYICISIGKVIKKVRQTHGFFVLYYVIVKIYKYSLKLPEKKADKTKQPSHIDFINLWQPHKIYDMFQLFLKTRH